MEPATNWVSVTPCCDPGQIAAIEDPSPLVVAALHRFLLAVLYRALEGPTDIDQAKALFREGLPGERITAYLDKWRDRFWLFDEKYPFGQIPTFEPTTWRAWMVLAAEHNADNAKVLFDHVDVDAPGTISGGAAARWILATQTFSVSCGKSELSHTGTAPSATAAMAMPLGRRPPRHTSFFSRSAESGDYCCRSSSVGEMSGIGGEPQRGHKANRKWVCRSIHMAGSVDSPGAK